MVKFEKILKISTFWRKNLIIAKVKKKIFFSKIFFPWWGYNFFFCNLTTEKIFKKSQNFDFSKNIFVLRFFVLNFFELKFVPLGSNFPGKLNLALYSSIGLKMAELWLKNGFSKNWLFGTFWDFLHATTVTWSRLLLLAWNSLFDAPEAFYAPLLVSGVK